MHNCNKIKNENDIREAWFLFPRNQIGLCRFGFWLIIWLGSVVAVEQVSTKSLANAYLIFTLSLIMEFYPHFSKYPEVVDDCNRALIKNRKGLSTCFMVLLGGVGIVSAVCSFEMYKPEEKALPCINKGYTIVYIIFFIYLFINCIMGMIYVPKSTIDNSIIQKMNMAAETGSLGNASSEND